MPERTETRIKRYVSTYLDEKRFQQTKNPIYVIKAFIEAHETGRSLPSWALKFAAEVFKKFDTSYGKEDLNKLLGFKKGKGQSPSYNEYFREKRYKMLCFDVFKLVRLFDMSIIDASHLVAVRMQETSDYCMPFDLKKLSEKTIEDKYKRRWGRKFENSSTLKAQLNNTPKKDAVKFLNEFNEDLVATYKDVYTAIRRTLR